MHSVLCNWTYPIQHSPWEARHRLRKMVTIMISLQMFTSLPVTRLVPPSLSYTMVRLSKLKIYPQILCTYFSWKTRKEEFLKPRGKTVWTGWIWPSIGVVLGCFDPSCPIKTIHITFHRCPTYIKEKLVCRFLFLLWTSWRTKEIKFTPSSCKYVCWPCPLKATCKYHSSFRMWFKSLFPAFSYFTYNSTH
jgi:hypothetical protein